MIVSGLLEKFKLSLVISLMFSSLAIKNETLIKLIVHASAWR